MYENDSKEEMWKKSYKPSVVKHCLYTCYSMWNREVNSRVTKAKFDNYYNSTNASI